MPAFFISDTHFGHENIIRTCRRPFASVAEMDEALVARWNERVGAADTIYHLGDFCYRNSRGADTYMRELNGQIHLIAGNHDDETIAHHAALFASVNHIREIHERGHRIVFVPLSDARVARIVEQIMASLRTCPWPPRSRAAWIQPRCRRRRP